MVVEMPKEFEAYLPRNSMYHWPRMLRYRWSEHVRQRRVVEECWIASSHVVLYLGMCLCVSWDIIVVMAADKEYYSKF
jgi:hypothetical protein